ncbi:MAG: Zn-dependent hydrolase [Caldilineaceae bacterium]|nr:Zn-dependent hydrolase [Caldilineaceae bacterium]
MLEPTINAQRLLDDLEALAQFTEPDTPGWTRRFPSDAYRRARQWLRARMETAGLATQLDNAGNLFGRRDGAANMPPIHAGSHTDTVMGGGRYDGTLGVLGALEAARAIADAGIRLRHPLVVADHLSEEATDYAIACLGSLAMCTGHFRPEWLARQVNGVTLRQAMLDMGAHPEELGQPLVKPGEIAAFLELHIEQGPVLEARGATLAAVSGIVGIRRALVELAGKANHAGATPMDLRHDALAAAARIIVAVEEIARAHPGAVGAVGKLDLRPNQGNVIPAQVTLMAEMRSLDMAALDAMWADLLQLAQEASAARGVTLHFHNETRLDSVTPPRWLHELVLAVCRRHDPKALAIPSGAGHDASHLALVTPAAMIFVPSVGGRSHAPEEYTDPADLARGVHALADAIVAIDRA